MKQYLSDKLSKQLLTLIVIIFGIIILFLVVVLPQMLVPVAEKNLYISLRQPLEVVPSNIDEKLIDTEIGYLYLFEDQTVLSDNLSTIIRFTRIEEVLNKMTSAYGKFIHRGKIYYYYTVTNNGVTKIALTNDTYIATIRGDILSTVIPIVFLAFLIISLILITWSGTIVGKIGKLKMKIDHIDDDTFDHAVDFKSDDELKSLAFAIEDMRISLKDQEEYRNQMYQNISHDFKTPLTVIKSYIEAVHDQVEDPSTALEVIEEQTAKLEQKVHSLLYLNKLDYLKDSKEVVKKKVDIRKIITTSVEKFKFEKKDLTFTVNIEKNPKFMGTEERWETVIDNLLANFIRYAEKEIKITVRGNKITLYNDGPNIEPDLLDGIFTPFRKGIKGEFGLGLSIVKKTLTLMGYDITIHNHSKKGVSFVITKGTN